jgi:hypothetical protein
MVEVLRPVAVDVGHDSRRPHPHQPLDLGDDRGLLEHLPNRGDVGVLARVDDAGHWRPRAVVGPLDEQHLRDTALTVVAKHHGRDARHPQQLLPDHGAQMDDIGRDRHTGDLNQDGAA